MGNETNNNKKTVKKTTTKKKVNKNTQTKKTDNKITFDNIKEETKTKNKENKSSSDKLLLIIFILLLIVVLVLGIFVAKEKINNIENADISVPVYKEGQREVIIINVKELSKKESYIIKIRNYMNNKINSERLYYSLEVENNTKTKIKVTKNNSKKDLMKNQSSTTIDGKKLKNDEEEEIFYKIEITEISKIKDDDVITVVVQS